MKKSILWCIVNSKGIFNRLSEWNGQLGKSGSGDGRDVLCVQNDKEIDEEEEEQEEHQEQGGRGGRRRRGGNGFYPRRFYGGGPRRYDGYQGGPMMPPDYYMDQVRRLRNGQLRRRG